MIFGKKAVIHGAANMENPMPPDPVSHETLIQNFIAPCDKVLSERVAILATIYGSVMSGGQGFYDERIVMAKLAMGHFLEAIAPA